MAGRVAVVGAGPGGLTAAMLLSHHGYEVDVYEKENWVGGRTSSFTVADWYTFDLGPTFLMMPFILEEMFAMVGRDVNDYLEIKNIDPLYRLVFDDGEKEFYPTRDRDAMHRELNEKFPGSAEGYDRFRKKEGVKYEKLLPCLQSPYDRFTDFFKGDFIRALPTLDPHVSLIQRLSKYFPDPDLQVAFTFQAKYLGMSPWECPGGFSIISYIEHTAGIWHVMGGLNRITKAMAEIAEEQGGRIHLNTPVKKVNVEGGRCVGLTLDSGDVAHHDDVVLNPDFGYAMKHLVDEADRPKYTDAKLARKKYSCSTFMLYLALDTLYDIPHHNILFADDYKRNVDEISLYGRLSEDPSVYVHNPSITDPSLAPEGHSALYVLAPVANTAGDIDWENEKAQFRERVLDTMERRGGMDDLRSHIVGERMLTPPYWRDTVHCYNGATFNLAHNIGQMLYFRPHNRFEQFDNCYLVGGGTHPGSGLPTIFESARISAGMMLKRDGLEWKHPIAESKSYLTGDTAFPQLET